MYFRIQYTVSDSNFEDANKLYLLNMHGFYELELLKPIDKTVGEEIVTEKLQYLIKSIAFII